MHAFLGMLLFLLVFQSYATPISRILEAEPTLDDDVAGSIAVITGKKGKHFCTATVLNEYWLLTAAHCKFRKRAKVRVGRLANRGTEDTTVKKFIPHPEYNGRSALNDIALVHVKDPLHSFYPVRLYFGRKYLKNYWAIVAGYGASETANDELNQKQLKIITLKSCNKTLRRKKQKSPPSWSSQNYLCAGKKSVAGCGDDGGPILVRSRAGFLVQVGVLTTPGICKRGRKSSAKKGGPNVYVATTGHTGWIVRTVTGTISVVGKIRKSKRKTNKQLVEELEQDEVW